MPECNFEELIPIFSVRYARDHVWLDEMLRNLIDSFTVHGLLVSVLIVPTCTKLVRMWNRLGDPVEIDHV